MGTNFYLDYDYCPCCSKPRKTRHVGKSSVGWKFLFWKEKDEDLTIEKLKEILRRGIIRDEYGREYSVEELFDKVDSKQSEQAHSEIDDIWYESIEGYDFTSYKFS